MDCNTSDVQVVEESGKINILLCVSGSVAAVKIPELVMKLCKHAHIRIVCTKAAMFFLKASSKYNLVAWKEFQSNYGRTIITEKNHASSIIKDNEIGEVDVFITDDDEWACWSEIGDSVLHIDLVKWANLLVVAPASADILTKISIGISDNLVLSILRAWNYKLTERHFERCKHLHGTNKVHSNINSSSIKNPDSTRNVFMNLNYGLVLVPAMNTVMYEHPMTSKALTVITSWNKTDTDGMHTTSNDASIYSQIVTIAPVSKLLACGDRGNGAMAHTDDVVKEILKLKMQFIQLCEMRGININKTCQQFNMLSSKQRKIIGTMQNNTGHTWNSVFETVSIALTTSFYAMQSHMTTWCQCFCRNRLHVFSITRVFMPVSIGFVMGIVYTHVYGQGMGVTNSISELFKNHI